MRFLYIWAVALCCISPIFSQEILPIAQRVSDQISTNTPKHFALFRARTSPIFGARDSIHVRNQTYLSLDIAQVRDIQSTRPPIFEMELPALTRIGKIQVIRSRLFAGNYQLRTSSGKKALSKNQYIFYHGIVEDDPKSIVAITFVNEKTHMLISTGHSNYRIHETDHGQYVFYDEGDLNSRAFFGCGTEDPPSGNGKPFDPSDIQQHARTGNCMEVYFECDHASYQNNGSSVANTEAWVAALFNEVSILYANQNVPLSISEIFVWDTPDIYQDQTSTSGALSEFRSHRNTTGFNGRLAHLLSTRGLGGGIAYLNVLCSNSNNYAVSANLSTNIVPFPNYSWNVNVVAHELGHNFGSPHTHACSWNGNNTQIDDCGNVYLNNNGQSTGSCFDENNPIIPQDGSVMSYCHLNTGNGISFNVGFGPQPGGLIYSNYINASCNTGACAPPDCVALSVPSIGASAVSVFTGIEWENAPGADGYRLTIGTSPENGSILNNQDIGAVTTYDPGQLPFSTTIYVLIIPYNAQGDAFGCTAFSFNTESDMPPTCTSLVQPVDGSTNVNPGQALAWNEANGFVLGYKLRIGTQPGGSDVMAESDLGDVTTYAPGSLPSSSDVFVQITPYGTQGDANGCPEESFTTNNQLVYCESAGQNVAYEWISAIEVGAFQNQSGSEAYGDFTADTIEMVSGMDYPLSISPGYANQQYEENYRIWIDLNADGDFDDAGEMVFSAGPVQNTVTGTLQVNIQQFPLITRMRVAMKWNGVPGPCEIFEYGEVEDYSVRIVEGQGCDNLVTNTALSGPGSLNAALDCAQPGDTIFFSPVISFSTIDLTEGSIPVDMPLTLAAEPGSQVTIRGLQADRLFDVSPSGVLQIEGLHLVSGISLAGSTIQNAGTTILQDVVIHPNQNLPQGASLIENAGILQIRNNVSIMAN